MALDKEIEKAVIGLFSDTNKQELYSQLGRKRMEDKFDWLSAANKYLGIFNEAKKISKLANADYTF